MTQRALFRLECIASKGVSQATYNSWSTAKKVKYLKHKVAQNYHYIDGIRSTQMKTRSRDYAKWCESVPKPNYFDPEGNPNCVEDGIKAIDELHRVQSEEGVLDSDKDNMYAFISLRNKITKNNAAIFDYDPKVDFINMSLQQFKKWGYDLNKRKLQQDKNRREAEKLRKNYKGGLFSHYNNPDD